MDFNMNPSPHLVLNLGLHSFDTQHQTLIIPLITTSVRGSRMGQDRTQIMSNHTHFSFTAHVN